MEHTIITERIEERRPARAAAVNALAVVGFLALVFIGIVLAIYAARYIPLAVSGLMGQNDALTVVPTLTFPVASSTPVMVATSTPVVATTTATTTAPMFTHPASPIAKPAAQPIVGYTTITSPYPTPGATQVPVPTTYSGLPNLTVSIVAVGYVNSSGNFVADNSIDSDDAEDFAAQILVTNNGTNKSGTWDIETVIPTEHDSSFDHTESMASMEPGASFPIFLRLTRGEVRNDDNDELTVTVDSSNDVRESNENDNEASASFDVR